jgi:hypothetical protein
MSENVPAAPAAEKQACLSPEICQKRRDEFLANMRRVADSMSASSQTIAKLSELPEKLIPLLKQAIDSGSQYVSKIITVGYASFFAIWAMTRTYMTPGQVLLTAILMLISVAVFVANEVWNVAMLNRVLQMGSGIPNLPPISQGKINNVTELDARTEAMAAALKTAQEGLAHINVSTMRFQGLRRWALRVALVFAIGAVSVMVYALVNDLWLEWVDP